MLLSAGTRLGPYEIVSSIGAGGMGEVYRGRDMRLNRDVAIKVSQERFSGRFEREAQAVAALNHPNICTLYDVGPNYLVMELIEGKSPKGPMPFADDWRIASQIALALEYAHEKEIIHRDLKPANVKVTPQGVVKLLDFGLAKTFRDEAVTPLAAETSATLTLGLTQTGAIVGTAAYMSPEQATCQAVDKRTDIWSFGVMLYELLTGECLFHRKDVPSTLAAVLSLQPDLGKAPAQARRLLRRCLEKDPKARLRDVGDAQYLLEEGGEPIAAPPRWAGVGWIAAAVLLLALAALSFVHLRQAPPPRQALRYTIAAPEGSTVHSFAISPDGHQLVISAVVSGTRQLWLRAMDGFKAQPMPSTEDGMSPFWSPDSRYIGFFAQGKLKKVAASGGPAQSLCDALDGRGGSWGSTGTIVFSPNNAGISIQRVPAAGGACVDVTRTKGDHRFPVFLPDGRHFLYLTEGAPADEANGIFVGSLDGVEERRVLADVSGIAFAPPARNERTGHVLFARGNTLMAVPFEAGGAQVSGDVFLLAEGVSSRNAFDMPASVSGNGVMIYATGAGSGANQIGWYDRKGKFLGALTAPGNITEPAISPDEKFVVFSRATASGYDLWIRDLSRGTERRFTSDPSHNGTSFWSPQGDRIVFASNRGGKVYNLYQRAVTGNAPEEPLLPNSLGDFISQWSRDGRFVVYFEADPKTRRDLWVLPMERGVTGRKPFPFLQSEFNELYGQLSPDSHWMAFTSDRSGRREVYVRPFPRGEGEWSISIAGGQAARWRGDGKELYFEGADGKMMAVAVKKAVPGDKPVFDPDVPVALFDAHIPRTSKDFDYEYDVTADGKRFLITTTGEPDPSSSLLTVVINWLAAARR
jgi:Tol biopolymer transport system component